MSGCGNGATAEPLRHRQTKGAETDMLSLTSPRHTATLPIVSKTYGPPRLQGVLSRSTADQSATTYPASEVSSRPRWRYARPGPHKLFGVVRRFQHQAS